ncbi:hypothetical protein [Ancylobacter defluvii]|uniref:Uncharacterized protein n=1 Tax=Ancylobacter defluvii TaxID=1282440 RepID=A0A9W6JT04_9HYPH|nr:hypothetical protein [Ancylobacter defluvii]GLK83221.1 hypothetical protein GCM10017653_12900 [Ancylobacter defluvii]
MTYDRITQRPLALSLARELSISFWPFRLTYGRAFDHWKRTA